MLAALERVGSAAPVASPDVDELAACEQRVRQAGLPRLARLRAVH